jgi:hypothetical protein
MAVNLPTNINKMVLDFVVNIFVVLETTVSVIFSGCLEVLAI